MHFFLFDSPETMVNNGHALKYMCYWLRWSFPRLLQFERCRCSGDASTQQHAAARFWQRCGRTLLNCIGFTRGKYVDPLASTCCVLQAVIRAERLSRNTRTARKSAVAFTLTHLSGTKRSTGST